MSNQRQNRHPQKDSRIVSYGALCYTWLET
jgi:hypothetical protein